MGFSISWIAIKALSKSEALNRFGLTDTGQVVDIDGPILSCAELPTGWVVIFANDLNYATSAPLMRLSEGAEVIACLIEEHVMMSKAIGFQHGDMIWSVSHDAQAGIFELTANGAPPHNYEHIRSNAVARQNEEGGEAAGVDYIFDIPVEIAESITGYRHDRWKFDWGSPVFTAVDPVQ